MLRGKTEVARRSQSIRGWQNYADGVSIFSKGYEEPVDFSRRLIKLDMHFIKITLARI